MIEFITEPLQYDFMARAFIVSALVGIMCPIIGAYIITRGLSFMGDALAHAVLPGMAIGIVLGVAPVIAALPFGIAVALLIRVVSRSTGLNEDTSIGILFAGMFALGLVIISSAASIKINIEDFLLGQILAVTQADVYSSLALTALVVFGLYFFHQELIYTSFDPVGSRVSGIKTNLIEYVLYILLALVIIMGIQAAGIVLVMAMLITPSASAYLLARRFVPMMVIAAVIGVVAAMAGLYISYHFNMPAGPIMTLTASGIFTIVAVYHRVGALLRS